MLDARILKLEEIIVELCNEEPEEVHHYSIEDLAEITLENRANEDRARQVPGQVVGRDDVHLSVADLGDDDTGLSFGVTDPSRACTCESCR